MKNNNLIWSVGAVIVAVGVCFVLFGGKTHSLGAISSPATNLDYLQLSQGLQIPAGPSVSTSVQGTNIQAVFHGTCNPSFSGTSLAATSTGQFVCTVAGVASGDQVFVALPAASRTAANSWFNVVDTYATTSNAIGFDISNFTGTATTSFAQATTGVQYMIVR